MYLSPKEIIDSYIAGTVKKANMSPRIILIKSILAGMMIAMGAAGSSVAAHGIAQVGIARLVAAVVFPVGLMMVILLGAELFTGDCLMVVALPQKQISVKKLAEVLAYVFIGNFIGGFMIVALVFYSGQLDYSAGLLGAYTIKIAVGKLALSPMKAVTSGILCNILVCAAVLMALCSKDVTGKVLVSFFVIMLFVTSGFEHCVANMYYISAGILAQTNPDYVSVAMNTYGITQVQLEQLTVSRMLIHNLLPVTIGNIIGGSFVIGLPMYYACKSDDKQKNNQIKKNVNGKEMKKDGKLYHDILTGIAQ